MRFALSLSSICLTLALTASPAPAAAQDYAVHLDRNPPLGHRDFVTGWHLSEIVTTLRAGGADRTHQQAALDRCVLTTEVLAVGARGNVLRAAVTVHKLTHEEDGKVADVLPGGTRVIASLDGDTKIFELGGKRLPKEVADALKWAVKLRADGKLSDDDTFGSSARHAIGDSWDANREAIVRDSGPELAFSPENITGTARLVGLRRLGSTPCLEVREEIALHDAEMTPSETPDRKMKIRTSLAAGTQLVPVDGTLGVAAERTQFEMTLAFGGDSAAGDAPTGESHVRETSYVEIAPFAGAPHTRRQGW